MENQKTIKDEAKEYKPLQTKNISDLEEVPINSVVVDKDYKDQDGNPFTLKVVTIAGEDYRVPITVLKNLKEILKVQPNLNSFRVIKAGEGLKTNYTVIPLS